MKTPLGTEVDLGPGHIVLDGVPTLCERGTEAHTLFSAHVYCGHGRPSQLLLSYCFYMRQGEKRPPNDNCHATAVLSAIPLGCNV